MAKWEPKEDDVVRNLAGKVPASAIAKAVGRSTTSVNQRAAILGLSLSTGRRHAPDAWSDEENAILAKYLNEHNAAKKAKVFLHNRSLSSIATRISLLRRDEPLTKFEAKQK